MKKKIVGTITLLALSALLVGGAGGALTAEAYVPQSVDNPNNLGIYLSIYVQLVLDKMKDYQKKIGLEHAFMIETGMT